MKKQVFICCILIILVLLITTISSPNPSPTPTVSPTPGPSPIPSPIQCKDSDKGKDYYVSGQITYGNKTYKDHCDSKYPDILYEYYCLDNEVKKERKNCSEIEGGMTCKNGICKKTELPEEPESTPEEPIQIPETPLQISQLDEIAPEVFIPAPQKTKVILQAEKQENKEKQEVKKVVNIHNEDTGELVAVLEKTEINGKVERLDIKFSF